MIGPTASTEARTEPDLEAFAREVQALKSEILADLGPDDLAHLAKIERWGRRATALGLATAWAGPNPISMIGLSLGRSTRWLLMHHVGHRGYDRVPEAPAEARSGVFATGLRRLTDFLDWIEPEAWKHEHNVMHHAHTGEEDDPDLIERNVAWVHTLPEPVRWVMLGLLAATWRATYYAPATTAAYLEKDGVKPSAARVWAHVALKSYLPYGAVMFGALPLAFAPLGPLAVASALANSIGADVLTNVHTFVVVGPNHAGSDLHRYDARPRSRGEHFARQVLGSTNYATGGDLVDFAHLWLNYQIEHHLFPDVPMLQYRKVQPKVKALCEKYGLPYTQESVVRRFGKMARIFVGTEKMRTDADVVLTSC